MFNSQIIIYRVVWNGINNIHKLPDRQFRIIYEDINNPTKFNYEDFIKGFNKDFSDYALKYNTEAGCYIDTDKQEFTLTYKYINNKRYLVKYKFYNAFPQAYIDITNKTEI